MAMPPFMKGGAMPAKKKPGAPAPAAKMPPGKKMAKGKSKDKC